MNGEWCQSGKEILITYGDVKVIGGVKYLVDTSTSSLPIMDG